MLKVLTFRRSGEESRSKKHDDEEEYECDWDGPRAGRRRPRSRDGGTSSVSYDHGACGIGSDGGVGGHPRGSVRRRGAASASKTCAGGRSSSNGNESGFCAAVPGGRASRFRLGDDVDLESLIHCDGATNAEKETEKVGGGSGPSLGDGSRDRLGLQTEAEATDATLHIQEQANGGESTACSAKPRSTRSDAPEQNKRAAKGCVVLARLTVPQRVCSSFSVAAVIAVTMLVLFLHKDSPAAEGSKEDKYTELGEEARMKSPEMLHGLIGMHSSVATDRENSERAERLEAYKTATGDSGIFVPTFASQHYADVWTPVSKMDVPMYWHIPKSGGTTVQDVLGHCLNMVQASDVASHENNEKESMTERVLNSLDIFVNQDGLRYVNVDTTTSEGLSNAKRLGLVSSGKADVIITHRLHDVSSLFDISHQGRAFTFFRHPVTRAVSMFYYLQSATWEPTYDEALSGMSLLEYAHTDHAEENWVVRSLTNEFEEPLEVQHVEVSKEILRRKVLVGIMEAFDQSVVRFEKYFGWWEAVEFNVSVLRCQRERMAGGDNRNDHPKVGPETEEFQVLADRNWADVELYQYAKELFKEQASLV